MRKKKKQSAQIGGRWSFQCWQCRDFEATVRFAECFLIKVSGGLGRRRSRAVLGELEGRWVLVCVGGI